MVDFDELTNFSCTPSLNRSQEVRHKALEDVYRLLQLPPHCCHHWREDLLLPWRVESWLTEHGTDPADNEAHWRSWHWYIVFIFFFCAECFSVLSLLVMRTFRGWRTTSQNKVFDIDKLIILTSLISVSSCGKYNVYWVGLSLWFPKITGFISWSL